MLTRLIVDLYAWIIEISLWLMLLIAGVVGYYYTVPMLQAAGAILDNEAEWQIYGALFFVLGTFLIAAVVVGPFLMLIDIRKSVRAIETGNSGTRTGSGSRNGSSESSSSGNDSGSGSGSKSHSFSSKKGRRMPMELKEPSL